MGIIRKIREFFSDRVLFMGLDGTLIRTESGRTYQEDYEDWVMIDGILDAMKGYRPDFIFIVTNQGWIEKGYVDEVEFNKKMHFVTRLLETVFHNAKVEYAYCKGLDRRNKMMKPNVGMVRYFLDKYCLCIKDCLFVGSKDGDDKEILDADLMTARNMGMRYIDVNRFIACYGKI